MGRLSTALAVSAGGLAAIYVAACILPNGPSDAGRVQFTLDFPVPYRVPLAGVVEPQIAISADGQVLKNPTYRLESLDPSVVRVDATERGLLGMARGTASVRVVYQTATGAPDTVFAVRVVVAQVTVDSPTLSFTRLGDTSRLKATAFDAHGAAVPNVAFTWSSSDSTLAWVDAGLVTALDEGTVAIAAEADSVKGVASVAVTQVAAGVQVLPETDTLHTVGRSVQFSAFVLDSTGDFLPFAKAYWTSSDPAVAIVDGAGRATAESSGTARIIARVGAAADTATLVVQQVIRFLFVTPSLDTLTAIADTSRIVSAARDSLHFPIPNPAVTWATGDPTIATVDPTGRVTAVANGVVLVTASSAGQSVFATVLVRQEVAKPQISADSVALSGQGDTVRLGAVGLDRNGYPVAGAALAWRSGSWCVATVDAAGLVTAGSEGSAAIIAAPANGGQSDTALVTVAGAPSQCDHAIAFVRPPDGIYVMNAFDGSGLTPLTGRGLYNLPVWSPDGSKIAFAHGSLCICGWIHVMNADGSGVTQLTNTAKDYVPAWSPDGTRIAFRSFRDGNYEIYVMNADGSGQVNLTNNPGSDQSPAWSPDGTRIAFYSNRDGNSEIYVMNADGSGATRLTNGYGVSPVWSPDGTRIAFASGRDGNSEIYVMNADGSGQLKLTNNHGYDAMPVWSPDGSGQVNLTNNPGSDQSPAWSPDGTRIAFYSNRDGNSEIYVMNADGSGQVNLTNNPGFDAKPVWSPDGTRIAFVSDRDGNAEIYVMPADGSGLQNLTNNLGNDEGPVWSPDGRRIAFASDRDGNSEIYVMNANGSGQVNLTNNPGFDAAPAWRPR